MSSTLVLTCEYFFSLAANNFLSLLFFSSFFLIFEKSTSLFAVLFLRVLGLEVDAPFFFPAFGVLYEFKSFLETLVPTIAC